mmetsp:Transcript_30252/g.66518  ORF Transcript_30252/g.66518 Transcript_30252/m.66518 type:complete len:219 (-) Transcript_30252:129-785(-)
MLCMSSCPNLRQATHTRSQCYLSLLLQPLHYANLLHISLSTSGLAPISLSTTSPFLMKMKVGMAETLYLAAVSGFSSTSTFRKTALGLASLSSLKSGAIILHGPHHVAEKSIMTSLPSAEALRTMPSTSDRVAGSSTAPPRSDVIVSLAADAADAAVGAKAGLAGKAEAAAAAAVPGVVILQEPGPGLCLAADTADAAATNNMPMKDAIVNLMIPSSF